MCQGATYDELKEKYDRVHSKAESLEQARVANETQLKYATEERESALEQLKESQHTVELLQMDKVQLRKWTSDVDVQMPTPLASQVCYVYAKWSACSLLGILE